MDATTPEQTNNGLNFPSDVPPDFGTTTSLSTAVMSDDGSFEDDRGDVLRRAVETAGLFAASFGITSIEVWVMNGHTVRLERPEGGVWIDPSLLPVEPPTNPALAALARDDGCDYVAAAPVPPGIGLPGALWSETGAVTVPRAAAIGEWAAMDDAERTEDLRRAAAGDVAPDGWNGPLEAGDGTGRRSSLRRSLGKRGSLRRSLGNSLRHLLSGDRGVLWREVGPMAEDPDRLHDARLCLYARAGLGLAAGVRFDVCGNRGVVIFLAPESADMRLLRSQASEAYLRHATGVISAAIAPARAAVQRRATLP